MFQILIIDDNRSIHAFVKNLLGKAERISVECAMNGAEAVNLLKAGKKFDLIFLDWEMPILDGPHTFEEFKSMGVSIPVIMMTTKNSRADIVRMLDLGVNEYLIKPFTVDILFEKIKFASGRTFQYAAS